MRFVKEYANYKKQLVQRDENRHPNYKDEALAKIQWHVRVYERRLITADEAVKRIAEV